jgi:streptomycin 6-kinase
MKDKRLNAYINKWQLSDVVHYTETHTSRIYVVTYQEKPAILKLLHPDEIEEQRGAIALRHFNGQGAVQIFLSDQGAQLLEYAYGPALVTLVEEDRDEEATKIMAGVIRNLHTVPQTTPTDGLVPLQLWFQGLISGNNFEPYEGEDAIFVHGARVAEKLLSSEQDIRILHGDVHHYNIRKTERGWLSFDPKGLVGERTYDCANALCNPVITELVHNEKRLLRNAAIFADTLNLDKQRILDFTFAFCCLNASQWIGKDGGDKYIGWYLKIAAMIEHLID